ncbi:MAG: glycoside hydrolase family 3 N-terminal domain-containing protein [Myxococcota bacterium]
MTLSLIYAAGCGDNVNNADTDSDAGAGPDTMESDAGSEPTAVWPEVQSAIPIDPEIETAVAELLAQMTLEQKVGQMMQAEIQAITPEQVKEFHIGSVLNGGGSWPDQNKNAPVADWVALADSYYNASMDTSGGAEGEYLAIPLMWGSDAVHGHSNVMGATLFPHNIGLGAAADPDLIEQIGVITAKEVAVTGIDWTFAPTLAVVRDDRWGRTYEGYSEDPELVRAFAGRLVSGLQGAADSSDLFGDERVVATAKHFVGDGGTALGKDQGDTEIAEQELIDIHAQGYVTALAAGAQTVMASFSSWNGDKMHGNGYLLTDILRGPLGFDGFVIGDWNGHGQVPGCSNDSCAQAINAGVDMVMVPYDWQALITNTIAQVESGDITMERIDEAVTRILRVKMRAGLLGPNTTKGAPSTRPLAGQTEMLAADEHRAVAREAVRKSLVLLKNKAEVLPLVKSANILVAGKGADDIGMQSGGWTLSWQGTGNTNEDFPNADSIYAGIAAAVEGAGGSATLSPDGGAASPSFDAIIAVVGETPYAEGQGDINRFGTLEHALRHPEDMQLLETLRAQAPEVPIITVFLSGRPMWVNAELNRSDAFVAAWLPGSEGAGVADVLFGDFDFTGKLSYAWPERDCQTVLNRGDDGESLFPYGFGLTYNVPDTLGDDLTEEVSERGCDAPDIPSGTTNEPLELFTGGANRGDYVLRIGGPSNWGGLEVETKTSLPDEEVVVTTIDGQIQGSAKLVTWSGTGQVYSQLAQTVPGVSLAPYANSQTELVFRARVDNLNASVVMLATHCEWPCLGEVPLASTLQSIADGEWHELRVPLQCFLDSGLDILNVNTPFLIYAEGEMTLGLEDIRWEPMTAPESPDCSVYSEEVDVIDQPEYSVYSDGPGEGMSFASYMNDATQQVDLGDGNLAWVGNMMPGTNISIHKDGPLADMSAYDVAGATLSFDILITSYENDDAELLIKVATDWPNLSDVKLFDEILGSRPAVDTWTSVTIPAQTLIASENDLEPGNSVDISRVSDVFVIEAIDGTIQVQLDNIRWTK